MGENLSNYTC